MAMKRNSKPRRKQTSPVLKLFSVLFLLFACMIVLALAYVVLQMPNWAQDKFGPPASSLSYYQKLKYSTQLLIYQDDLLLPVSESGSSIPLRIEMGESIRSISLHLYSSGIIRSADMFTAFLIYSGLDSSVQAGDYELDPAQNAVQIAQTLQDATPREVDFQILAGWRLEEIAAALPTSGFQVDPQEFYSAATQNLDLLIPLGWPTLNSLEGFLLPGVYHLPRDISKEELIKSFVDNFDEQVMGELDSAFQNQGLDLLQAVTLASIVQREDVIEEEQPIIASVFLNRLAADMKLESDPTVQYALGFNSAQQTWWTNPLTLDDLDVVSPFNTYENYGLPPAPISNPGISALRAVAYPAQTSYYYFRAACDGMGSHTFSKTYQEHLENSCP
jgi:UPF0755 protein